MIANTRQLIRNGGSLPNQRVRHFCLDALEEALSAVDPTELMRQQVSIRDKELIVRNISIPLSRFRRVAVLAYGKGSAAMMGAALDILKGFSAYGILVIPKGTKPPALDANVQIFGAGHPIPDREGIRAGRRIIRTLNMIREDELLLCLISGGASAMLTAPQEGISLRDKQMVTELLVRSGTSIHEINTVRKHLSKLKGGRLANICRASTILSLIVSDVPGNRLTDIASGPTVEDPTTYNDAVEILKVHNLWDKVPERVRNHLTKGVKGEISETPKPGDPAFQGVHNIILADNRTACEAAKKSLEKNRVRPTILTSSTEMEAKSMGRLLASIALDHTTYGKARLRSDAVIIGGETTVQVKGEGIGGRNQETALSAVEHIADLDGCVIATLGTDGIDGTSEAAGAIADGKTAQRAKLRGMNPKDFLSSNDSYHFFRKLSDNLITGPTGTNVGDLYLVARSR